MKLLRRQLCFASKVFQKRPMAYLFMTFLMLGNTMVIAQQYTLENQQIQSGGTFYEQQEETIVGQNSLVFSSGSQSLIQSKTKITLKAGVSVQQGAYLKGQVVSNFSPRATDQSFSLNQKQEVDLTLGGTDLENDALQFKVTANPTGGQFQGGPSDYTYTPNASFSGSDLAYYKVFDGNSYSLPGKISLDVSAYSLPYAELTTATPTITNQTSISVQVGGVGVTQYKYSLDGQTYSTAQSSSTTLVLSSLSQGEYTLSIVGGNAQNQWQPENTATVLKWTVDLVVPSSTIMPGSGNFDEPITVNISASEEATIHYTTDGSTPTPGGAGTLSVSAPVNGIPIVNDRTVRYFAEDQAGNQEATVNQAVFQIEDLPPQVLSTYPVKGALVPWGAESTASLNATVYFSSNNGGINLSQLVLWDEAGNDITSQATATSSRIDWAVNITRGANKLFRYRLKLVDNGGQQALYDFYFTVDDSIPNLVVTPPGGDFSAPINVSMSASEAATIYYSLDGVPPLAGQANTFSATNQIETLSLSSTTLLQAYAKDNAGNESAVAAYPFHFEVLDSGPLNLQATYSESTNEVTLTWDAISGSPQSYNIYRVDNLKDRDILAQSANLGVLASSQYRLASSGTNQYVDSTGEKGSRYWYAVSVTNSSGLESLISALVEVELNTTDDTLNIDESISRAIAWLKRQQLESGLWGESKKVELLSTSKVLDALFSHLGDNYWIRRALFTLQALYADNNDYLARKVLTLGKYGLAVDEEISRLVIGSKVNATLIEGWGLTSDYRLSALTTLLGKEALKLSRESSPPWQDNTSYTLTNLAEIKSSDGRWGWVPRGASSVFVSAMAYASLSSPTADYDWIVNNQNPDGSFGLGVIDTAAVLKYLTLSETKKNNALAYMIAQQDPSGHWANRVYVTAFCLEALSKVKEEA